MHQDPTYLGYVQTATGNPTLIFDTGFLVQWDRTPELCGWYAFRNHHQIAANVDRELIVNLVAVHPTSGLVSQVMAKVHSAMASESSETSQVIEVSDLSRTNEASVASDQISCASAHPGHDSGSDDEEDSRVDSYSRGHSDTESDSEAASVLHAPEAPHQADLRGQFLLFDSIDEEMFMASPIYVFAGALVRVDGRHPVDFDEKHALAAVGGFDGTGKPIHKKTVAIRNDLVRFI